MAINLTIMLKKLRTKQRVFSVKPNIYIVTTRLQI